VVKRSGDVTRLQALVDKKRIVIIEEVVHEILQLNDAEGVICMPNDEIFAGLARMGFIQLIIQLNIADLSKHTNRYIFPVLTQKVFANMRRVGKGFSEHVIEEIATEVVPPTPTSPSSSSPVLDKCSALVLRVEGPENANAAQQLEIIKLKARVKKLERLNKVKSSKLRRLKKVGTSQRIKSSDDIENVFYQGRISVDMETDEGIELEVNQKRMKRLRGGMQIHKQRYTTLIWIILQR
nr:hypothetical protein [Tanacetum cinerariifolium]